MASLRSGAVKTPWFGCYPGQTVVKINYNHLFFSAFVRTVRTKVENYAADSKRRLNLLVEMELSNARIY